MKERSMRGVTISRGTLGNSFLTPVDLKSNDRQAESPEEKLTRKYFEYRVQRLLRTYRLSDANDLEGLRGLLESAVRLAFGIVLSKTREESKEADKVPVRLRMTFAAESLEREKASSLGDVMQCILGHNMILGRESSEAVPCVQIRIELKMSQLSSLRSNPRVLRHIMFALERLVPLNLDYRLSFVIRKEDWCFRIDQSATRKDAADAAAPVLGVSSVLGAG